MNKTTLFIKTFFKHFSIVGIICFSTSLFSQDQSDFTQRTITPTEPGCIYYVGPYSGQKSTPVSQDVQNKMARGTAPCSNFVVIYNGFTPEAQAAFQYAVDIWAMTLESSQTIRVSATFADLPNGTLGSAGSGGLTTLNPATAPGALPNTFYAIALAEKLANTAINSAFAFDIVAQFNNDTSEVPWYFGTDANPGPGQQDFVTVVLHELGHGLGFSGAGNVEFPNGSIRLVPSSGPPGLLTIYDTFTENGSGVDLSTFPDPSTELRAQLTGSDLFSNSPTAIDQNGAVIPEIYAPFIFSQGSSYSHWDETVFGPGNVNSLMSPQLGFGEANHNPGPITMGFFQDMGWSICGDLLTVEDFILDTVEVSPNPFTSEIAIKLSNGLNDDYKINLFDINGRVVLSESKVASNGTLTISNLEQLEDAFYFIKITNVKNGSSITKKVIKN